MSYYAEKVKEEELKVSFATVGFMKLVREIGDALSCCTADDVKCIAEKLTAAVDALEDMKGDLERARLHLEEHEERMAKEETA